MSKILSAAKNALLSKKNTTTSSSTIEIKSTNNPAKKIQLVANKNSYSARIDNCVELFDTAGKSIKKITPAVNFEININLGKYMGVSSTDPPKLAFEKLSNNGIQYYIQPDKILSIEEDTSSSSSNASTVVTNPANGIPVVGSPPNLGNDLVAVTPTVDPTDKVIEDFEQMVNALDAPITLFNNAVSQIVAFKQNSITKDSDIFIKVDNNNETVRLTDPGNGEKQTKVSEYLQKKKDAVTIALDLANTKKTEVDKLQNLTPDQTNKINVSTQELTTQELKVPPILTELVKITGLELNGGKRRTARKAGASKKRVSKKDKKTRKVKRAGRKA